MFSPWTGAADFPLAELPPEAGIFLADGYGGKCLHEPPP